MKKKELLNEIMGVPKQITPWINSFTNIIIEAIKAEIRGGWSYSREMEYRDSDTDEIVEAEAYKTDTINMTDSEVMDEVASLNGFSDIKEFMKSPMFQSLPLWRPEIQLNVLGIPEKAYNQEKKVPMDAEIRVQPDQKLSNVGKITVFPNVGFAFEVIMPTENINNQNFITELKTTISHELLHAYQKFKQLEYGGESHFGKETVLNILSNNAYMNEIELTWWKEFLHLVYLHLSFEINARVNQVYYELKDKGIQTTEEFVKAVKKTSAWQEMRMLESFNAKDFIDKFVLPGRMNFSNLASLNPMEALHGMMQRMELKKRGLDVSSEEETMKSLILLWDVILSRGLEFIEQDKGIKIKMDDVPKRAKEDPYVFFKFFEKRFHKKAKTFKRKLYRLASLVIQNEEDTLQ